MNIKRKEAAVKAFAGTAPEELADALAASDKNYTPDEITEIMAAIAEAPDKPIPEPDIIQQPKAPKTVSTDTKPGFSEVHCMIKAMGSGNRPKVEKLKTVRAKVAIQPHQAHALNEGLLYGGNNYANLYFADGDEYPFLFEA